jgi:ABC-type Fe3+/spermidine/putrescine transport system ATPase subunit
VIYTVPSPTYMSLSAAGVMKDPTHVALQIEGLEKSFDPIAAVRGIDLAVADGEFFTLLAPSGRGKTTIFRTIAGICRADRGRAT